MQSGDFYLSVDGRILRCGHFYSKVEADEREFAGTGLREQNY